MSCCSIPPPQHPRVSLSPSFQLSLPLHLSFYLSAFNSLAFSVHLSPPLSIPFSLAITVALPLQFPLPISPCPSLHPSPPPPPSLYVPHPIPLSFISATQSIQSFLLHRLTASKLMSTATNVPMYSWILQLLPLTLFSYTQFSATIQNA